jgi:hypothetical protein
MFNYESIDKEKLAKPSEMFKIFAPTNGALAVVADKFIHEYLFTEDSQRNYDYMNNVMFPYYFGGYSLSLFYEIRDFRGLVGFVSIEPEYKCNLVLKLWDKKPWGLSFVKEGKNLLQFIMKEFCLKRINTSSPDERIVKMATKFFGFKVEGKRDNDFKWNNELFDNTYMGLVEGG